MKDCKSCGKKAQYYLKNLKIKSIKGKYEGSYFCSNCFKKFVKDFYELFWED